MPKLEANLQWMFNEYDLIDRYDAAARAGFNGVELQAPYSLSIDQIVERLERNSLSHVIINLSLIHISEPTRLLTSSMAGSA